MDASNLVIKVRYGDMLRRFNALTGDSKLGLNIDELREKIISLFNLAPNAKLMLSYIDEDADEVTLVDDDDLCDVVRQALNPLRITVKLNVDNNGRQYRPSGSSTSLTSARVQQQLNSGVFKFLKPATEPTHENLVKFLTGLESVAPFFGLGITEIADYFTKVGLSSYLAHCSESLRSKSTSTECDVPECSTAATGMKNSKLSNGNDATLKVQSNGDFTEQTLKLHKSCLGNLEPCATLINCEKCESTPRIITKASSLTSHFFDSVAHNPETINVDQTMTNPLKNPATIAVKSKLVPYSVGKTTKKAKVRKIGECYSNEMSLLTSSHQPAVSNKDCLIGKIGVPNHVPTEKVADKPSFNLGLKFVNINAPDPIKVDNLQSRTKSLLPDCFQNFPGSIWASNSSSLKLAGSLFSPSPGYECPFSGVPMENVSASSSHPASQSQLVTFSRSSRQNSDNFHIFHCGVQCDGCGVHPITGPRFKSKVKVDYDLCMICFAEMGNASDYTRMDRPVVYPFHVLHDPNSMDQIPMSQLDCRDFNAKSCLSKLDSCFIQDVNIVDGTIFAPLTPFTKIWQMRNNGTVVWPPKTQLIWIGGDKLGHVFSVELKIPASGLGMDQDLDVAVDCLAPEPPGKYVSYWAMASPSGQTFGQLIWVLIQVDASVEAKPCKSVGDFNLNLPHVSGSLADSEIINLVPEPLEEDNYTEHGNSEKVVEFVESAVHLEPNKMEMKLPVNNSLLVGSGTSRSVPSAVTPVWHPIIDFSDVALPVLSISPDELQPFTSLPVVNKLSSAQEFLLRKEVEEKLLDEPLEMSFNQANSNKNNLELDDPWDFSEWDHILDELEVMGFHDTEKNMKLLEKNNGSIKRVVMALIAAEKIH